MWTKLQLYFSVLSNATEGAIHLVRAHEGGRGSSKSVHRAYKGGGGLSHLSKYAEKSLFVCIL